MTSNHSLKPVLVAVLLSVGVAQSQTTATASDPLRAAVQKALTSNPDVTSRLNAMRAAAHGVEIARGAYLPRIDLEARVAQDRDRITSRTPESGSLSHNGIALSINQTLWDGLITRSDTLRAGHEKLTRQFELQDVTEQTALEVVRTYYDVLRYRKLVALAEDNYVQHKYAFSQIQSRFRAGVGRGVDLEQANARLALAESNLTTELANLHDVSARYQRIVGEAPATNMPAPVGLNTGLPVSPTNAITGALANHPAVSAAVENMRATQAVASARKGLFQPKVDARLRTGVGNNFDGVDGQKNDTRAEIVLNWNLYNGGADRARVRQQADQVNQAADLRDKACRDARQTAAIAFNDTTKLSEQLGYLDRNTLAIEKARDAYRQQFDIGQRSLLDLLNAENELYTARRAYANADHDLGIANARTHASMQQLLPRLGLSATDTGIESPAASGWSAGDDAPTRCPVDVQVAQATTRADLDARAQHMAKTGGTDPAAASTAPVTAGATTAAMTAKPAAGHADIEQRVRDWAAAWSAKDVTRYLGFYDKAYAPAKSSHAAWVSQRTRMVGKAGDISVKLDQIRTKVVTPQTVETSFQQTYTSNDYKDQVTKTLTWKQVNGQWVIVKEAS